MSRKPRAFSVAQKEAEKPAPAAKNAGVTKTGRKPRAIDMPTKAASKGIRITTLPEEAVDPVYAELARTGAETPEIRDLQKLEPEPASPAGKRRAFGWGKLALSAFTLLAGLALSLWLDSLVRDLFARNSWLGYAALALTGLLALAVLAVALKEIRALWRLRTIDGLRQEAEAARNGNNLALARRVSREVSSLLADHPETARGRALIAAHDGEVMDGRDVIGLVERDLLAPMDQTARAMIMGSAKRVSVVTGVSPRALIDVGFVLFENVRLIRRIGEHYGGKPGFLGSARLVRQVVFHLGATGAIAVGDGLLQQVIGHGLAAKLSARLGEGVVNGLLTARIGLAAMDICRPVAFGETKRPKLSEFMSEIVKLQGSDASGKADD